MLSPTFFVDTESALHTSKSTETDPERRQNLRQSFGVSGVVDFEVMNRMWKAHRDPDLPDSGSLEDVFPEFHRRLRNREALVEDHQNSNGSGIRALLMLGTISLMNIEDATGKVETELIPFLSELRTHPEWDDAIHRLGVLLVGNTENPVRCRIVVYFPHSWHPYTHVLSDQFCFRMCLNSTSSESR